MGSNVVVADRLGLVLGPDIPGLSVAVVPNSLVVVCTIGAPGRIVKLALVGLVPGKLGSDGTAVVVCPGTLGSIDAFDEVDLGKLESGSGVINGSAVFDSRPEAGELAPFEKGSIPPDPVLLSNFNGLGTNPVEPGRSIAVPLGAVVLVSRRPSAAPVKAGSVDPGLVWYPLLLL